LVIQSALPLLFEQNRGQFPPAYDFVVRHAGGKAGISAHGITFAREPGDTRAPLRIVFEGAATSRAARPSLLASTRTHYIDARSVEHHHDTASYQRVAYPSLLPGVDVEFYGNANWLEYDFVLEPGTSPETLRLRIEGADSLHIDEDGNLHLERSGRHMRQRPPRVFQGEGHTRREIAARYTLSEANRVGFALDAFNPALPLTVDPILEFATFFAGEGEINLSDHAVDAAGNLYIIGYSWATTLPGEAQTPVRLPNPDPSVLFISKLSADWQTVIFTTYISWESMQQPTQQIAVASDGSIYFGYNTRTYFQDIRITRPLIGTIPASPIAPPTTRALLGRLAPDGASLDWTTMISCSDGAWLIDLAADSQSRAVLGLETRCRDYPITPGAVQPDITTHIDIAAAVTSVNADGYAPHFSTMIGGGMADRLYAIRMAPDDDVILSGFTNSPNFPVTPGAFSIGPPVKVDGFLTRIAADGSRLVASTLLGGSGNDTIERFALDSSGEIVAALQTDSPDLPTTSGSFAPNRGSASSALIRFSPDLRTVTWASYLPNLGMLTDVSLDPAGQPFFLGWHAGIQPSVLFTPNRLLDRAERAEAYLGSLDPTGTSLTFGTSLPGVSNALRYMRFVGQPGHSTRVLGWVPAYHPFPISPEAALAPSSAIPTATAVYLMKLNLEDPTQCSYSVTPEEQSIGWRGGEVTITVTAPPGCPWITNTAVPQTNVRMYPLSGIGGATIRVPVDPNPYSTQTRSFSFKINQAWTSIVQERASCDEPTLSPASLTFPKDGGVHTATLSLPFGCPWRTSNQALWFQSSLIDGFPDGQRTFTVSAGPNDFAPRTSSLLIAGLTLPIHQEGGTCTATAVASTTSIPADGGTSTILVTPSAAQCTWQPVATSRVALPANAGGTGSAGFTVSLSANPANVPLTETILVAGNLLSIVQAPGACSASFLPSETDFGAQGGLFSTGITASGSACAWLPSPSVDWIVPNASSTSGSGYFTAIILPNGSGVARSGTLQVLGRIYTITQQALETVGVTIDGPWYFIPFRANGVDYLTPHTLQLPPGATLDLEATQPEIISPKHELLVLSGWNGTNSLGARYTVPAGNTTHSLSGKYYSGILVAVTGNAPSDGSTVHVSATVPLYRSAGEWAYYPHFVDASFPATPGSATLTAVPGPGSRFVRWVSATPHQVEGAVARVATTYPSSITAEFAPATIPPMVDSGASAAPSGIVFRVSPGLGSTRVARVLVERTGATEVAFLVPNLQCAGSPAIPFAISQSGLTTPFEVQVSLHPESVASLPAGQYNHCMLQLEASRTGVLPLQIPLSLHVQSAQPQEPQTLSAVNAASYTGGAQAVGSIVSAFGLHLAPETGSADSLPLPGEIHRTRLLIQSGNRTRVCPLFYVSPSQINFLIPGDLPPGPASLMLYQNGVETIGALLSLEPVKPALFAANANGSGPAAGSFVRVEGERQTAGNLVDCTPGTCVAQPVQTPASSDGKLFLTLFGTGIRHRSGPVEAEIDGNPATVTFAGPQGHFEGLDQVNLLVPQILYGTGVKPVRLRIGDSWTNTVDVHF
jgi:uncharacterized protein (TIGR03437 family)